MKDQQQARDTEEFKTLWSALTPEHQFEALQCFGDLLAKQQADSEVIERVEAFKTRREQLNTNQRDSTA